MTQTRLRPAGTGRGDDAHRVVLEGRPNSTTARAAIHRLPYATLARYSRTCATWRTIHAHHRAMLRLLREVA